jgi:hypothetical protein
MVAGVPARIVKHLAIAQTTKCELPLTTGTDASTPVPR